MRINKLYEKLWAFFRFLILFGLGFVISYPLIYMISCSFRDSIDMNDPTVIWIPRHFTLQVIQDTMKAMDLKNTLINTLTLNIGCSLVQTVSCSLTGYGFAKFDFRGKKLFFMIVVMMIIVPPQIISLASYSNFVHFGIPKLFTINLINSKAVMYLPALTGNGIRSGLMIFIFRQFFSGLPKELEDSACIDGCSPFMTFIKVIIPNSVSTFITVFLFSVVFYWNDYYTGSTYFTHNQTMGLMLKNLNSRLSTVLFSDATIQISSREEIVWLEAGCLLTVTPMLLLYIFLQKYFTEGIEYSGIVG